MNITDFRIWTASVLFTAFIHGLLFMQWGSLFGESQSQTNLQKQLTRLTFNITEAVPEPGPVYKKPQRTISKIKKKVVLKKSSKAKAVTEAQQAKIQPINQRADIQKLHSEKTQTIAPAVSSALLNQQRELYIQQLMSHIEKYKFYPLSARRRGLQGKVAISFKLASNGDISDLKTLNKYTALKKAAQAAVMSALPLPLPPENVSCPLRVNFNMLYAMQ